MDFPLVNENRSKNVLFDFNETDDRLERRYHPTMATKSMLKKDNFNLAG